MTTGQKFASLLLLVAVSDVAIAQTPRAVERRAERNERQLQRQTNRAQYYGENTWQQLNPWLERNGVRAAANAVNRAANAVDQVTGNQQVQARTRFGYQNQAAENAWFYDYYTLPPTYYSVSEADDRYGAAIRYYDADSDGVFDSYVRHRDADNDGNYDEYDRLDFSAGSSDEDDYYGPGESKRYSISGMVKGVKKSKVGQQENLVISVEQEERENIPVDIGPIDNYRSADIQLGAKITATGWIETIGDKKLLVADKVSIAGLEAVQVTRDFGKPLQGTIIDIQRTEIRSVPHYVGIVETGEQKRLVDLGPVKTYKQELAPNTQVVVYGVPIQSHGHEVILADQIEISGEKYSIDRSATWSF